jgi:hypothetical protein
VWPQRVEGSGNPSFAACRRFDPFYIQNCSGRLDLITVESLALRVWRPPVHLDGDSQIVRVPPEHRSVKGNEARKTKFALMGASIETGSPVND